MNKIASLMDQENENRAMKSMTVYFLYLLKFYNFPLFRLTEQYERCRYMFNR